MGSIAVYAGGGSDKGAGGLSGSGTATIQVFHYMLEATKQSGLLKLEEEFCKKNPNVKFDNIFYNQGVDYFPQLSTALASGEQPQIIMGNPGQYPDLIKNGYAMDLSNNAVIKSLNLPAGDLGDVSANKIIYGFPIDFKTWGVFYNVDIFNRLGLKVPTKQSEMLDVCRKIAAAGIDPWAHCFSDAVYPDIEMRNTVWTRGVEAKDLNLFESLMNGSKKLSDYPYFAEGLKVWQERMRWARKDAMANSQDKALEIFLSGQAAMIYMGSWNIGLLASKIGSSNFKFDFFIAPIDENPQSQKLNVQVDQAFMVNPKAKNSDVALKFMEFWITDGAPFWSEATMLPLTTGKTSDKLLPVVKTLAAIKQSGKIAHYGDFTRPFTTEYTTAYRKGLTAFAESAVTGGTMTSAQCIANLQAAFDNIRATSKYR
jgi:raffinose/stachyose/melibiose transport system substrate-binding protein